MKKVLVTAVTAMGILVAGCTRESGMDEGGGNDAASASLTITIHNADENTNSSRASGAEPTLDEENNVFSFAVYVFSNTGALEKSETFSNTLTGTVSGLNTTSNKNIVVLVNYDYTQLTGLNSYQNFTARTFELASQNPDDVAANGLFMSGEVLDEQLISGENEITIGVKRAVAKVRLGTLTVSPNASSSLDLFVLTGVSMQKVPSKALMLGDGIPTLADNEYLAGIVGTASEAVYSALLYTAYSPTITASVALNPEIYFYVFPNDNSQGNPTMLTIEGTYQGNPAYYTFIINDEDLGGGGQTDGTYIKKNTIYTLNITLASLANYVSDPNDHDLADVIVTIDVADWEGPIIQNVVW